MTKPPVYVICLMLLCSIKVSKAQTAPFFDNYFTNKYLYNPAFTGIESFTEFQLLSRSQWSGIDGAPQTSILTVQLPLGNSIQTRGFSNKSSFNSTRLGDTRNYRRQLPVENHSGLGLSLYSDKIGPFTRTQLGGSYAYHLYLGEGFQLSSGFRLSMTTQSLNTSKLIPASAGDPLIESYTNRTNLNVQGGLLLSHHNGHIGISTNDQLEHTAFGSIKALKLYYLVELWLIGVYRINEAGTSSYDLGANITWQGKVYSGLIRRSNNEILLMAGYNFHQNRLGFNFLYNVGLDEKSIGQGRNNSLEVSLILRLSRNGELPCFKVSSN